MDRQHPLWDMTVVRGLKGDRTGAHHPPASLPGGWHCGVGIMNALLDASPEAPRSAHGRKLKFQRSAAARPVDFAYGRVRRFLF